mmetsp:Transcript_51237/g.151027  ORF Transcript_51237/g.151027 Transcript_51237/m.151027 type:complete len:310 (-) Transcript_51237:36-965(-)
MQLEPQPLLAQQRDEVGRQDARRRPHQHHSPLLPLDAGTVRPRRRGVLLARHCHLDKDGAALLRELDIRRLERRARVRRRHAVGAHEGQAHRVVRLGHLLAEERRPHLEVDCEARDQPVHARRHLRLQRVRRVPRGCADRAGLRVGQLDKLGARGTPPKEQAASIEFDRAQLLLYALLAHRKLQHAVLLAHEPLDELACHENLGARRLRTALAGERVRQLEGLVLGRRRLALGGGFGRRAHDELEVGALERRRFGRLWRRRLRILLRLRLWRRDDGDVEGEIERDLHRLQCLPPRRRRRRLRCRRRRRR